MIAPINDPSSNGNNGQDAKGRFLPGNKLGRGNPFNKKCGEFKTAFFAAIQTEDVTQVAKRLIRMAKKGDLDAIKEVLNRTLGKVGEAVEIEGDGGESMAVPRDVLIEMLRNAGQRKQPGAT